MTPETYNKLSDSDKLLYNEFFGFGQRMTTRLEEISELLKTLIAMVNEDPE